MPLEPGKTLLHYQITGKIGEGGMGAVYRATDTKLNRDVVLRSSLGGIFEFANEAIVTADSNGLISLFNPAAERIFGYKEEEVLGRSLEILMPLSLRPLHERHMRTFVASSEVGREMGHRGEIVGRRQDGSNFPAKASIFKSTLPGGELLLTAILQDMSQHKEHKTLENSVRDSRITQLHFFPESLPQLRGVDLAGVNIPSDVISGDYYDFFKIVEGHWGLVIGDVAGKGIPAGLMMSAFRASLLAEIRNNYAVSTILTKVNDLLWETTATNRFVTAFYGVFDERHRMLTYCNAGHNFPILLRPDGSFLELETGGILLGAFQGTQYEEGHLMLSPGDLLLFYTDGLTEALSSDGQELGRAALPGLLKGLSAGSASEIVKGLITHLSRNLAEIHPADDVSLIVMKMTGPSDGSQEYPPEMPPRARV
jgi:PAS domain S-box-containing protein